MAYKVTCRLEEPGKKARRATVTVASMPDLKRACNALLRPGSKVTILRKKRARLIK